MNQIAQAIYEYRCNNPCGTQPMPLEQVAKKSGVSRSTLHEIVEGKREPSLRTAVKLADALGITLDALAGRK